MRSWIVEYRPKCGCTALKEPVDCGHGFTVYAETIKGGLNYPAGVVEAAEASILELLEQDHLQLNLEKIWVRKLDNK